jgi:hypothetical protein
MQRSGRQERRQGFAAEPNEAYQRACSVSWGILVEVNAHKGRCTRTLPWLSAPVRRAQPGLVDLPVFVYSS